MINLLVGALPGIVAAFALWLLAWGVRTYRWDPLDDVNPEELVEGLVLARATTGDAGPLERLGRRFVPLLRQLLPDGGVRRLQRLIDLAGRPAGVNVESILARTAGLWLATAPVTLFYLASGSYLLALLILVVAPLYPLVRLSTAARKRRERINRDLPDFLDVLAVTVSAGVGFRGALGTVASRFGGPLGDEVTTALHQITNGATVRSAFRNLKHRTGSESVDEFVTAYLQAEELGAPLVESLNQIALDMRRSGAQRALQQAAGVAPRITLISTLVMVPATLLLVVIGLMIGSGVDFGALMARA